MQISIILQNDHFVVVDKPGGVLAVPARAADDPRPSVGRLLEAQIGKRVWPVHRLDFEVSGILMFALDAKAHRAANAWFEGHQVQKVYHAWTGGELTAAQAFREETTWKSLLVRGKKRAFEAEYGKLAATRARFLAEIAHANEPALFWELSPLTGRSHQLRFEMTKHGFPIVGDVLYGSNRKFAPQNIALRAVRLDFPRSAAEQFGLPIVLNTNGLETVVKGFS